MGTAATWQSATLSEDSLALACLSDRRVSRTEQRWRAASRNRSVLAPEQCSQTPISSIWPVGYLMHASRLRSNAWLLSAVACMSGIDVARVLVTNMDADAQVCLCMRVKASWDASGGAE